MSNHVFAAKPPNKRPRAPFIAAAVVIALFFVAAFVFALYSDASSQISAQAPTPPASYQCFKDKNEGFVIFYPSETRSVFERLRGESPFDPIEIVKYCEAGAAACRFVFNTDDAGKHEPVRIIIYQDKDELNKAINNKRCYLVGGVAYCDKKLIAAYARKDIGPTIIHEITHLFIPRWYPAWADEGMAMFVSEASEIENLNKAHAYIEQYNGGRKEMFRTLMLRPSEYYKFWEFHSVSYSLTMFLMDKLLTTKFPDKTSLPLPINENKLAAAKEFVNFMELFQKEVLTSGDWREKEKAINQLFLKKFDIDIGVFIGQWERWEKENLGKI